MNRPWPPRDLPGFEQLSRRAQYFHMFGALRTLLIRDFRNEGALVRREAQAPVSVFGEMLRRFVLFFAEYWGLTLPDIVPPRPLAFYRDTDTLWDMYIAYMALWNQYDAIMKHAPLAQVQNRRELLSVLAEMAALFGCPVYAAQYDETADRALAWAMRDQPPLTPELTEMIGRQLPQRYRWYDDGV